MEKDIRLIALAFVVLISLISLSRIFFQKSWVEVSFINESAKCENLQVGSKISEINNIQIKSLEDFKSAISNIKKGEKVLIIANGQIASCIATDDKNPGFNVKEGKTKVLNFGIDIEGGTRVLLKVKGNATEKETQDIATILTERLNAYGLSDIKVLPIGQNLIQIEAAGLTEDDIRNFLVKQGYFEGKIIEDIPLTNGKGKLIFNGTSIEISFSNETIEILNKTYPINESFYLGDVKFEVINATEDNLILAANVFTAKDIVEIFTDVQRNYIVPYADGYRFVFTVKISKESAEKFAEVTKGQPTYYSGGQLYIKPKLVLYLDRKPITELNIVSNIAGEALETPSIEGFRKSLDEARLEKLRLESILKSGSLPAELSIERVETITQTEGKKLFESTVYILIANFIAVLALGLVRYKNIKIGLLILFVSICELILIFGVASSQIVAAIIIVVSIILAIVYKEINSLVRALTVFVSILVSGFVVIGKWTIDIPTIAGLISIIGNSGELITLTDQLMLEKKRRLEENIETGMEIVFNSSALLVFAMLPLAFLGLGSLKGFAITTTLGTLIDLFLTRPAYMKLIESIFRKRVEEDFKKQ